MTEDTKDQISAESASKLDSVYGDKALADLAVKPRLKSKNWFDGWLSSIVSAFEESWAEIKVNRARILLSLFGVVVSVCALATVVGIGSIVGNSIKENQERWGGRPATLSLGVYWTGEQGTKAATPETVQKVVDGLAERYKLDYVVRQSNGELRVQLVDGVSSVQTQVVDRDYGLTRRVTLEHGRWFNEQDERRLAPAIIVNRVLWERLGSPDLSTNPTVKILGNNKGTAIVVGVTPSGQWDTWPSAMMLFDDFKQPVEMMSSIPQYQFWVKEEISLQLRNQIEKELVGALGPGNQVDLVRTDYAANTDGNYDPMGGFTLIMGTIAVIVLILGALSIINIAMVTIRQRVREIGIRRSFGATGNRIFFTVMLESVVATVLAGIVGIIISVILLQQDFIVRSFAQDIVDIPPYPVEAAVVGLIASVVVGALSGLLPAIYATNAKVIEAIRY